MDPGSGRDGGGGFGDRHRPILRQTGVLRVDSVRGFARNGPVPRILRAPRSFYIPHICPIPESV
jgi:hypothetical protein